MVQCWDADCSHNSQRETCKFYRFPKPKPLGPGPELPKWKIVFNRRLDCIPSENARLCSCHFKDGIKKNGPTIFNSSLNKSFTEFQDPEPPKKRGVAVKRPNPVSLGKPVITPFLSETATNVIIGHLEEEIRSLKKELEYYKARMTVRELENKEILLQTLTGLPSRKVFCVLHRMCSRHRISYYYGWTPEAVRTEEQLLMTLMKLRLDYPIEDIAHRFDISTTYVTNIVTTWIYVLHHVIFKTLVVPTRAKNQACLPSSFSYFSTTRMILDCTEVPIEIPGQMDVRNITYSHYKSRNTFKGLVGVAPNGSVTFLSELYPGSTSDKEVVRHSGVLEKMTPGDIVMADKGFLIHDLMPRGVGLNIPPFLTAPQFTPSEVASTRSIARARIHVERAICRIKNFRILSMIPCYLRQMSTRVWQTCGALTNLQKPLIREVYEQQEQEGS